MSTPVACPRSPTWQRGEEQVRARAAAEVHDGLARRAAGPGRRSDPRPANESSASAGTAVEQLRGRSRAARPGLAPSRSGSRRRGRSATARYISLTRCSSSAVSTSSVEFIPRRSQPPPSRSERCRTLPLRSLPRRGRPLDLQSLRRARDLSGPDRRRLAYRVGRALRPRAGRPAGQAADRPARGAGARHAPVGARAGRRYAPASPTRAPTCSTSGWWAPRCSITVGSRGLDGGLMCTASHNPKAYTGAKLVKRGSIALSGDSGIGELREIVAAGEPGDPVARARGDRARGRRRRVPRGGARRGSTRPRSADEGGARRRQRHGRADGRPAARPASRSTRSRPTGSRTATSPTTSPTRCWRRTGGSSSTRCATRAPSSASPGTATPTAASSSTTPASSWTATSCPRCWPRRCCARSPARRSSTTCAPRARCATSSRPPAAPPTSTASATPSSRPACATRARPSAARSPATTTSATSTAPTPARCPRC